MWCNGVAVFVCTLSLLLLLLLLSSLLLLLCLSSEFPVAPRANSPAKDPSAWPDPLGDLLALLAAPAPKGKKDARHHPWQVHEMTRGARWLKGEFADLAPDHFGRPPATCLEKTIWLVCFGCKRPAKKGEREPRGTQKNIDQFG